MLCREKSSIIKNKPNKGRLLWDRTSIKSNSTCTYPEMCARFLHLNRGTSVSVTYLSTHKLLSALSVISGFYKRRLVQPVRNLLMQGMTPRKLAATVALGTVAGIVPAFGVSSAISTAIAARFRLNIAATVLVGYLVHPLQLLLMIPFIRSGIFVFGLSELHLSLDEMIALFRADWLEALNKLWMANLAGFSVWALVALPLGGLLYLLLLPVFRKVLPKPQEVVA